jgi:hypothetical protein
MEERPNGLHYWQVGGTRLAQKTEKPKAMKKANLAV